MVKDHTAAVISLAEVRAKMEERLVDKAGVPDVATWGLTPDAVEAQRAAMALVERQG